MSWFVADDGFDPSRVDALGNKYLISNGFYGYRGTLEEFTKVGRTGFVVAGLYDQVPGRWREPVNAPNPLFIRSRYRGKTLSANESALARHRMILDLTAGVVSRESRFLVDDGLQVEINSRRFAPLEVPNLLCLEYRLKCSSDGLLEVDSAIDGDVWDINGPHLTDFRAIRGDVLFLSSVVQESKKHLVVAELSFSNLREVDSWDGERVVGRRFSINAKAGVEYVLAKFCYVGFCDYPGQSAALLEHAVASLKEARKRGFEELLADSGRAWKKRWEACDVVIDGDDLAQQAMRFSLYHLLAIAPTHSPAMSIPARGLSAQVYKGAIFWDTEIYMFPLFNLTQPDIARTLLNYRVVNIQGARQKALEYGFEGVFFPWEGQERGQEACTHFNITDVFTGRPIRTYFRDKQIHINGAVVYALQNYYLSSGDWEFMKEASKVIFESARFFLSYSVISPAKGRYEIRDVTGPDEYHERVHNNAFTNRIVAHTLKVALHLGEILQDRAPEVWDKLNTELGLERLMLDLRQMSEALFVPDPRKDDGVIPQFDGYFDLEDVSLEELKGRVLDSREYLGGSCGVASNTQILKQADVILMMHLFPSDFSREIKESNFLFYEPRTEHGSSLSNCVYAIVAAQLGAVDYAYRYFMKSATIDMTGSAKQMVGDLYIGGTHPAANGGAWMAAVFGFGGFHFDGNIVHVSPHLPNSWNSLEFTLNVLGHRFRVSISLERVEITSLVTDAGALLFSVNGEEKILSVGSRIAFELTQVR